LWINFSRASTAYCLWFLLALVSLR
jgi:hypothetical protein